MHLGSASLLTALSAAVTPMETSEAPRPLRLAPSLLDVFPGDGDDALAFALRRSADAVLALQRAVVDAGAELVVAPTSATTAPALHATGQAYRAAALTAAAVDLTRDAVLAAGRPAWVLGEVPLHAAPGERTPGARALAEAKTHVERLLASSVDGVLLRGAERDDEQDHERVDEREQERDEALAALRALCAFAADRGVPVLVETSTCFAARASSLGASAVVLRGQDLEETARALAALRAKAPTLPVGARVLTPFAPSDQEQAQLHLASAWAVLSPIHPAILGVGGSAAVSALPALVELTRASRIRP